MRISVSRIAAMSSSFASSFLSVSREALASNSSLVSRSCHATQRFLDHAVATWHGVQSVSIYRRLGVALELSVPVLPRDSALTTWLSRGTALTRW